MAWNDISTTAANAWDSNLGDTSSSKLYIQTDLPPLTQVYLGPSVSASINRMSNSYNVPGFDDGYMPEGINDPIVKSNFGGGSGGGGGGSTRPSSGMLYPRGF